MFKTLSKLISSSISMAFLVVLGWSTAYAYGWGQSYFYGFPWWYVYVGTGNVARSFGYVIWVSIILLSTYLIGLFGLKKTQPYMTDACLSLLRTYILCTVFLIPGVIGYILTVGKISYLFILTYIIITFIVTLLFKHYIRKHISTISLNTTITFLYRNKSYVMLSTYCYFVICAFIVGYSRPHFKTVFDSLEIEGRAYYVLAKYSDTFILAKSIHSTNGNFYLYKIDPNSLCHVQVINMESIPKQPE
ncbi:hypothetical protein [Aggregatibacter actinomycetemcomitans]|uniref:hypothetical protein n=1 Tax=Aggregatibacter actinomycetemcomitans TaxID=714 RepID=UPI00034C3772|nr:hypothetical protein [Aggregatibacter actinomycetemcomitans]